MKLVKSPKKMSGYISVAKSRGKSIGFVPTMGFLHEGHLSLVRSARKENDIVVVSIFVNPKQFGPEEDFKEYPRDFKKDIKVLVDGGVDFVFFPNVADMYPSDYETYVDFYGLSDKLCGKFRPGHFKGVATVVLKLFNIIRPSQAYFGQKDAQQSLIIKQMVNDLNVPVKIRVMPIVRESDGLAMSSRNVYLNPESRMDATILYEALTMANDCIKRGQTNSRKIISRMENLIKKKKAAKIQYVSIVNPIDLKDVKVIRGRVLLALAVWFGKTRLIDNLLIERF